MVLDVVETNYPLAEFGLATGTRGTIGHCHDDGSYEVEFSDDNGQMVAVHALAREQFVVVWRGETGAETPFSNDG